MATLVCLFAPMEPIPPRADRGWAGTVSSFTSISDICWSDLIEQLPEPEQRLIPYPTGPRLSKNMASATRLEDKGLQKIVHAWTKEKWAQYRNGGPLPDNGVVTALEVLGIDSKISTADVIEYRGKFTEIPAKKLKRGGDLAFIHNAKEPGEFDFASPSSTERIAFLEIARAYGGTHLAIWTFASTVSVLVARSARPKERPELVERHFRLECPGRNPDLGDLEKALSGSAFTPDFAALSAQLRAPRIDVPTWFLAFGVPGAKAVEGVDGKSIWEDFEAIRISVLDGGEPDKRAFGRVQAAVARLDVKVPKKRPAKGDPNSVFVATEHALSLAIGLYDRQQPPEPPSGKDDQARYRAAMAERFQELIERSLDGVGVSSFGQLPHHLGAHVRYKGRLSEMQGGFIAFRLEVPGLSPDALAELRANFQGDRMVASYGRAWIRGGCVEGYMCADFDTAILVQVLADLPAGTELRLAPGPDSGWAFRRG